MAKKELTIADKEHLSRELGTLTKNKELLEKTLKVREALKRLVENEDYKFAIEEYYLNEEVVRETMMLATVEADKKHVLENSLTGKYMFSNWAEEMLGMGNALTAQLENIESRIKVTNEVLKDGYLEIEEEVAPEGE